MTPPPEAREAAVCANPDCGQPRSAHAPDTLWCPLVATPNQRFQPAPAAPPPAAPELFEDICPRCLAVSMVDGNLPSGQFCARCAPVAAAPSGAREELTEADVVMLTELMREAHIGQERLWRVVTALQSIASLRAALRGTP